MVERYRSWHFRYYPFFDRFFSHRSRDCSVSDRLAVCEWAASDPGRRPDRTAKLHWSNAHVCFHLRRFCCSIGITGTKSPQAKLRERIGHGVEHGEVRDLPPFGITILSFSDPDGIQVELTAPLE